MSVRYETGSVESELIKSAVFLHLEVRKSTADDIGEKVLAVLHEMDARATRIKELQQEVAELMRCVSNHRSATLEAVRFIEFRIPDSHWRQDALDRIRNAADGKTLVKP